MTEPHWQTDEDEDYWRIVDEELDPRAFYQEEQDMAYDYSDY